MRSRRRTSARDRNLPLDMYALLHRLSDQTYAHFPSAARRTDQFALLAAAVNADGVSEVGHL